VTTPASILIGECACWTDEDHAALQGWFGELVLWLSTSPQGKMEAAAANNHGIWYDVQMSVFSIFVDDFATARGVANAAGDGRIATQIQPDGTLPRELARTRSLHYTLFALQSLSELATAADHTGVDLWHYQASNGSNLRTAQEFVEPYLQDAES
jgi:Alginate lyase